MENKMPSFGLWLTLAIVETLCCNTLFGVLGIVFVALANSAYKSGNIADGESKAKVAKILMGVGLGLALLVGIIYVLYFVLVGGAMAMSY